MTTVANSGTCYDLTLLDKVTDTSGNLLVNYSANVRNTIDMPQSYWNAIHQGMRGVVQNKKYYQDFGVEVAGKTGTAEEDKSRPNPYGLRSSATRLTTIRRSLWRSVSQTVIPP